MLRPQDVNLKGGWIHFVGGPGWVPKTRQARKVPIHPLLMAQLKAYEGSLPKSALARAYFFSAAASSKYPDGNHPIDLRKLNVRFQKRARAVGVKTGRKHDGLVIHSLRHFFETTAVNSRIPQLVIDHWIGHSGDHSMGRVHYGRTDRMSRKFMKRVRFVPKPKLQAQPASSQGSDGTTL